MSATMSLAELILELQIIERKLSVDPHTVSVFDSHGYGFKSVEHESGSLKVTLKPEFDHVAALTEELEAADNRADRFEARCTKLKSTIEKAKEALRT